jgi:hypothetical protein
LIQSQVSSSHLVISVEKLRIVSYEPEQKYQADTVLYGSHLYPPLDPKCKDKQDYTFVGAAGCAVYQYDLFAKQISSDFSLRDS